MTGAALGQGEGTAGRGQSGRPRRPVKRRMNVKRSCEEQRQAELAPQLHNCCTTAARCCFEPLSCALQAGIPLIKAVQHGDVEARRLRKLPFAGLTARGSSQPPRIGCASSAAKIFATALPFALRGLRWDL